MWPPGKRLSQNWLKERIEWRMNVHPFKLLAFLMRKPEGLGYSLNFLTSDERQELCWVVDENVEMILAEGRRLGVAP